MMPDTAYDKFWATVALPTDKTIPMSDFLSKTRPNKNTNIRPAGVRIIKVPLGEETDVIKRKKTLFDPKSGPVPTWDNEWRQEEDKKIRAPTMTGIMNGVYYHRNTFNPLSRTPRQEWDMHLKMPLATAAIEGKYYGDSEKDVEARFLKRKEERY